MCEKCIFYSHPKSEKHAWGICHVLPFLLSYDNDNFFFPRIPSANALAKGQRENGKVPRGRTWQPPGEGGFVNGSVTGAIPFGVWPGAEQIDGEAGEKGGRQREEGQPHPLNPLCFLFCQRSKHLSQGQFHLN